MSASQLHLATGRVLVAAAWVDGQLDGKEIEGLKSILFGLPGISSEEWASFDNDLRHPVDAQGMDTRVEQLKKAIRTDEDREFVKQCFSILQRSSVAPGSEEDQALVEILDELQKGDSQSSGFLGGLKNRLRGAMNEQGSQFLSYFQKEKEWEDSVESRIRDSWEESGEDALSQQELRKLCLSAHMMGRIIHADDNVDTAEKDAMEKALVSHWGLSKNAASVAVDISLEDSRNIPDLYAFLRDFFEMTTEKERIAFLRILFEIAASDGMASNLEMEEIRGVSTGLLLSHQHFISAKVQIPAENRAS